MGGTRRARSLRAVLLVAFAASVAVLALVVVTDPRRIGVFRETEGRTAAPGEAGWVHAAAAPVALTEVAATAHQGRIWVAGGLDDAGRAVDHLQVYDPVGDAWAKGPALPEPVHHAALVSDGVTLFLIGGYTGAGFSRPSADVWQLDDSDGGDWSPAAPLPEPRGAGAAAWNGRDGIVYGGGVGPDGVSGEVFLLASGEWRSLATLSRPREHLAASSSAMGTVAFLGGRDGGGNLGAVDVVSDDGTVRRAMDLPTARGGIAGFPAGPLGDCAVGGESPEGSFATVECIGPAGATTLPGLALARHGLGAATMDGQAYALLGGPRPGLSVTAAIEILDLR